MIIGFMGLSIYVYYCVKFLLVFTSIAFIAAPLGLSEVIVKFTTKKKKAIAS